MWLGMLAGLLGLSALAALTLVAFAAWFKCRQRRLGVRVPWDPPAPADLSPALEEDLARAGRRREPDRPR